MLCGLYMTNKKCIWNVVYKVGYQSSLWPFIHYLLYLSNFILHAIFACVILHSIQATSALPFILPCFSNLSIFYKSVYSLVGRSPIVYMPYITSVLRCHVLAQVGSLKHVQPCILQTCNVNNKMCNKKICKIFF